MFKASYKEKRQEREGKQNVTAKTDHKNNLTGESFRYTLTASSWDSFGLEEHHPTTSSSSIGEGAMKWWLESPTRPIRRCSHEKRVSRKLFCDCSIRKFRLVLMQVLIPSSTIKQDDFYRKVFDFVFILEF